MKMRTNSRPHPADLLPRDLRGMLLERQDLSPPRGDDRRGNSARPDHPRAAPPRRRDPPLDDCRTVVGGIQNCEVILQRKASNQLVGVVSRNVARELQDRETREQGGEAAAGYAVDAAYIERVTRNFLSQAQLRELQSPLFHLGGEKAYVMRTVLVREEADFNIWEDLLDRAKAENRERVARGVQLVLKEKYGDKGPKRSEIEKTEAQGGRALPDDVGPGGSPKGMR